MDNLFNESYKSSESFFYQHIEELMNLIEEKRANLLKERADYNQTLTKIRTIKEMYPKVRDFIENEKIVEFSKDELKAILEIINLNKDISSIELEETFKLGIKEGKLL